MIVRSLDHLDFPQAPTNKFFCKSCGSRSPLKTRCATLQILHCMEQTRREKTQMYTHHLFAKNVQCLNRPAVHVPHTPTRPADDTVQRRSPTRSTRMVLVIHAAHLIQGGVQLGEASHRERFEATGLKSGSGAPRAQAPHRTAGASTAPRANGGSFAKRQGTDRAKMCMNYTTRRVWLLNLLHRRPCMCGHPNSILHVVVCCRM